MIQVTPLRTQRLTVEFNELTAGDVIRLCALPGDQSERGISQLLSCIVAPCDKPKVGQITDPRFWTVQERSFAVSHYIAHIAEDGPDFGIGKSNKYSDYILNGADAPCEMTRPIGVVSGDEWFIQPLLGAHSEAIERLIASGRLNAARDGWWVGAMAAQLYMAEHPPFDIVNGIDAALDEHIASRAAIFLAFPESDFMDLLTLFLDACDRMAHLMRLEFLDDGIAFLPAEGVQGNPARFPVSHAISERATKAFGRPEGTVR